MRDHALAAMQAIIQEDAGNRGLRTDPHKNLITACAADFPAACRSLAEVEDASVAVVTGFYIPHAQPPCGETDGPLGALFLARALTPLGVQVVLATDTFCTHALEVGLEACGLKDAVPLVTLPSAAESEHLSPLQYWQTFIDRAGPLPRLLTHLIALERAGPSHTPESIRAQREATAENVGRFLQAVPAEHHNRCHTMRGRDITASMSPAHQLIEACPRQTPSIRSIGIGDGGNEIGMGKVPWEVVQGNIPGGGLVACRVPADQLIVCGVSNWGAYGLAAGVRLLRGQPPDKELFDVERERELLQIMVERGPLVDGVTGKPTVTVDGLSFERYVEPLRRLGEIR